LLLLINKFLGAAPRAFERAAGPSLPIFKSNNYISDEQFSFEKLPTQRLPFLKAGHDLFRRSWKSFQQIQKLWC
jgi:hypothetical protein